jgi:serine/threonine-protein kinase
MVHRDIKPGNLIVVRAAGHSNGRAGSGILRRPDAGPAPWGTVKILDLGLARGQHADASVSKLTHVGSLMGTPDYISPEQVRSSRDCDIRSDLYGLGCTFYYLLAGQHPFPKGSVTDKLYQHQFEEAEPVENVRREILLKGLPAVAGQDLGPLVDVPPDVAGIIRRLMAKDPAERLQTPGELAALLIPKNTIRAAT